MSEKEETKERYIEYPEVEIITGGDDGMHQREGEKVKKEPETITLTRFHFLLILICGLFVLAFRLVIFAFAGLFAFLAAFRNDDDNAKFSDSWEKVKEMFWHCIKLSLGVLVPSWGAKFF